MFYEQPSVKSTLDGFFSRPGKTINDVRALFGFDKFKTGIPYELLQACTLKIYSKIDKDTPFEINMGIESPKNCHTILKYKNYNDAEFVLDLDNNTKVTISFDYRTDNFPSIGLYIDRKDQNKRYVKYLKDLYIDSIDNTIADMKNVIDILIEFFVINLYKSYNGDYYEND